MPVLTTVIDDKSPLISYDATWLPGTSQNDNYAVDYYLGTFQKNSATDGTATFSFNGTAIWIYGANRPNHGIYTVQLDSQSYPGVNGSGNNLFQQSLFSANVSQAMHTVSLMNNGGASGLYVDIDMIVWQSEVGSAGDQLIPELVQDADPRFQYQQASWQTTSSTSNLNLNLFNNGTGHVTDTSDASVSFTFSLTILTGEAVTLFGASGPSNGPYSVQLDDGQAVSYNASNAYPTNYGIAIYHADNLGPGAHRVALTNLPAESGQYLAIDYAMLWTTANATSATSSSSSPSSNYTVQSKLSSGAIAGLVVEGVIAVMALAAAAIFYWRWRTALTTPRTPYTPEFRSPGTTTATATDIAPSLEALGSPISHQNNTLFQPLATVGRSYQQLNDNDTVQGNMPSHAASNSIDSRQASIGGASALNEAEQAARGRPLLSGMLGGEVLGPTRDLNTTGLPGDQRLSGVSAYEDTHLHPPPGYDTAVRGSDA